LGTPSPSFHPFMIDVPENGLGAGLSAPEPVLPIYAIDRG
jgi:hypothetical protein